MIANEIRNAFFSLLSLPSPNNPKLRYVRQSNYSQILPHISWMILNSDIFSEKLSGSEHRQITTTWCKIDLLKES